MRSLSLIALALVTAASPAIAGEAASPAACADASALATSRIVEIDTTAGPLYGNITKEAKEDRFLKPKEVVLTFDDGPMPWVTRSILDTLDRFCAKATFFSVGKMGLAYPQMLREVLSRGHTLGGHTHTHPLNLKRLKPEKAIDEIDRGFAALSIASGGRASPFFRFPGLSDNAYMLDALQKRGIAAFSVDVVSDDSYISDAGKLVRVTLERVEAQRGGILLFHDIKAATAKALPTILAELQKRGYSVVHMRAKNLLKPSPELAAELQPILAKSDPPKGIGAAKAAMMPFFGTQGPERITGDRADAMTAAAAGPEVEQIAPAPRERKFELAALTTGSDVLAKARSVKRARKPATAQPATVDGWSTSVNRVRLNRTLYD
jgi:peptidoglycan/xylan/chitin deacetylase (PgdA/CDA1 family)